MGQGRVQQLARQRAVMMRHTWRRLTLPAIAARSPWGVVDSLDSVRFRSGQIRTDETDPPGMESGYAGR